MNQVTPNKINISKVINATGWHWKVLNILNTSKDWYATHNNKLISQTNILPIEQYWPHIMNMVYIVIHDSWMLFWRYRIAIDSIQATRVLLFYDSTKKCTTCTIALKSAPKWQTLILMTPDTRKHPCLLVVAMHCNREAMGVHILLGSLSCLLYL